MDRTLVGILLICFIGSSIPVFLFLGERAPSPISVLKVEYPTIFGPEQPRRFALNILAREDIEDLTVEYAFLYRINKERRACELRRGGTVLCGDRGEHGEGGHAGVRFIGMSGLNFPEESD